jgi:uncharacterized cupredoxin-like copper-binding protein
MKSGRGSRLACLLALAFLMTALSGCTGLGDATPSILGHMAVTLEDFKLTTSVINVPSGRVSFDVTNNGPSTHEFNVDGTNLAAGALPLDASGLFVAEDSPLLHRQGSVESAGIATRHKLTLNLAPGSYVVYCDLEGHYLSGMHVLIHVH